MNIADPYRHVKIVATLGPASNSREVIRKLLLAGMNIVRLNLNYGTLDEHRQMIADVRSVSRQLKRNTGVLLDLPGSKRTKGSGIKAAFGEHLEFAVANQADFIALSFITSAHQVREVRRLLTGLGGDIPLITKIERARSLEESGAILEACQGIMVARGDLASEISIEKVPAAQKHLVRAANRVGKPVITATQMLESMMQSSAPTRAEATDVYNAVLDGSDALMLSGETTIGSYPVESVSTMSKIIFQAEAELPYREILNEDLPDELVEINDATARAACEIAFQIGAKFIIAFTTGGATALRVSKYRPRQPILAVTPNENIARRLALSWGVLPVIKTAPADVLGIFDLAVSVAREIGGARKGDLLVITAGVPPTGHGGTNLIKVHQV